MPKTTLGPWKVEVFDKENGVTYYQVETEDPDCDHGVIVSLHDLTNPNAEKDVDFICAVVNGQDPSRLDRSPGTWMLVRNDHANGMIEYGIIAYILRDKSDRYTTVASLYDSLNPNAHEDAEMICALVNRQQLRSVA